MTEAAYPLITTERWKNVGLSISGGGVRALAFHLGVFFWLAKSENWDRISTISSVSGGSLAIGLILSSNNGRWPTADEYLNKIFPLAKEKLETVNIQKLYIHALLIRPWLVFRGRAHLISKILEKHWGLSLLLSDLPDRPEIWINCTTYETGKNWRFSKVRMGDYISGYFANPNVSLSTAISASAAFPGLIGPLKLKLDRRERIPSPLSKETFEPIVKKLKSVTLWDGGVYENLGVEKLIKNRRLQGELDFLIVSDASGNLPIEKRRWKFKLPFFVPSTRLTEIASDQVRSLRSRDLVNAFMEKRELGVYFRIGNTSKKIFQQAGRTPQYSYDDFLDASAVEFAGDMETHLKSLDEKSISILIRHGFEVARSTVEAHCNEQRINPNAAITM